MTDTSRMERGFFRLTRNHLLRICPIIGLMAGGAMLWLFGLSLWTLVAFLLLIACPAMVAWALVVDRQESRTPRKRS